MTPVEEQKIAKWGQSLEDEIHIEFILTKDERSEAFRNFVDHLTRLAPKIRTTLEKEEESALPGIRIRNVRYHAIPLDKELDPFLKVMADRDACSMQLPSSVREQVDRIEIPALLKVYITPQCPFCPTTVMQLISLAAANEFIKLTIIDAFLFREMAETDNIQSAPTILLDDQFRWSGSIQIYDIFDIILNRDPSRLSEASLESMLKEGDAVRVAEMMIDSGSIFPAYMELLIHEKWPVRLGAMVAFETIAVKHSELLSQTIPFLWERFPRVKDTVKGDILYLYGQSNDERVIPKLEAVIKGQYNEEIREAAIDALQELNPC